MHDSDLVDRPVTISRLEPEQRGHRLFRHEGYQVALTDNPVCTMERDVLHVGKVVVIVPVDLGRDEVVLIREFRLGAHFATGRGDVVELPAGRVERDEDLDVAARRECQEEIGVDPDKLIPIFSVMPTPGTSDELQYFYLAVVDASKVPERAGAAHEQEETRPMRVPIDRAIAALGAGGMHYGAAVFGLQWLALNRARIAEIADRTAVQSAR